MTEDGKKVEPSSISRQKVNSTLLSENQIENISQAPVNVLFNPNTVIKKDVWEINIIQILEILIRILKKADKKDLRVAGMAALSSSLIHRMKVERIFALEELMDLLENLIGTIANPRSRKGGQLKFEPIEAPDFKEYFVSLESLIGKYEELILRKLDAGGVGFLHTIIADLDTTDSIRCFFAILFLARDQKVDLEQVGDDIKITILKEVTP